MTATADNVLPMPAQGIAAYSEFRAQLAELRDANAKTIFDYESKDGNKAARSYVHTLRRTKTAVDDARKQEKAASLEYGRKVDAEAKEIIGEIQNMIDVHQSVIDEIEQREKTRVAKLEQRYSEIVQLGDATGDLSTLKLVLENLNAIDTEQDATWQEFKEEAAIAHAAAKVKITAKIAEAEQIEKDRAELARLKAAEGERLAKEAADKAEAERIAHEQRIAEEAAARAKLQAEEQAKRDQAAAEAAAQAERDAAAKREAEQVAAREQAERDAAAAEVRAKEAEAQRERDRIAADEAAKQAVIDAEKRAAEAVQAEKDRVAALAAREAEAAALRRANEEHRQRILGEVVTAMSKHNGDAVSIVNAIVDGNIPHITIKF